MDMYRVTAQWNGFVGAPGYSNFFFATGGGLISDAQQVADRVHDGFTALVAMLPNDVRITIDSEVATVDSDTGEVTAFQAITQPATVVGTSSSIYSGPSGGVVNWRTADLRNGRRIRGRTFIVPMAYNAYDDAGSLSGSGIGALTAFAQAITGTDFDSEFGVWSRPVNGSGGVFASVTGFNVPDLAAVLRSRRD